MHSARITGGQHCWLARALVLLLLCVQLTVQAPLPSAEEPGPNTAAAGDYSPEEAARQLWNGAKKLARKSAPRVRRQNGITLENEIPPELETVTNVTESAPKYILEVYRNLSNRPEPTEANTIRSLQTIANDPVCGEYTFDFQGINPGEWILFAELRLYLKPTHFSDPTVSYVVAVEEFRGHNEPVKVLTEFISLSKSGLHEFKVTSIVSEWVSTLAKHPHRHFGFRISVYPTVESYQSSGTPFLCDESPIKFYSSKDALEDQNRDKEPLLAIFSYDPITEYLDLGSLINETSSNSTQQRRSAGSFSSEEEEAEGLRHRERRRRSADISSSEVSLPVQSCRLNPLTITASNLNSINLIRNHKIVQPSSFDAKICGGQCDRQFPRAPQHAMLVHILINRGSLNQENYEYTSCCAPVQWEHLDILSIGANGAFQINRLKHMIVTRCECIDILRFR